MGAEVTVLSGSRSKQADALRLGAHEFALTSDAAATAKLAGRFDLIIDTVSAPHDLTALGGKSQKFSPLPRVGERARVRGNSLRSSTS